MKYAKLNIIQNKRNDMNYQLDVQTDALQPRKNFQGENRKFSLSISGLEAKNRLNRILNIHHVDLCFCQYRIAAKEIMITGELKKTCGVICNLSQVEALIMDLVRVFPGVSICGNLKDWSFTSGNVLELAELEGREP